MATLDFKTSRKERLSYGSYFLGQNIIFMIVLQFLMIFYTDVVGIGAAAVGIMFGIARTWDAINDPLLGILVDKANPKKGKFKPWVNAVIPIIPLLTIFLFINPRLGDTGNLIYAYVTYILWGMAYTISDVPIFALATVMTDRVDERTTLITYGRIAGMIAMVIAMAVFMPVVTATSWTTAIIIMMVLAFLTMIPIKHYAVERIVHDRGDGTTLKDIFIFIKSNKYLLIFYSAFLITGIFNTVMVVQTYYAKYLLGDANMVGILGITGMAPLLILLPLLPRMIRKVGKKNIYVYSALIGIGANVALYFSGYNNLTMVIVFNAIRTATAFTPMMMMGLFSADFVEYGNYVSGKRAEGVSFSVQTFATKFSQAIGAVLAGFMIEKVYHFVPNADQSVATMNGIHFMYSMLPNIGMVIGVIIIIFFYNLKEDDVQRMIDEMAAKEKNK